MIDVPRSLTLPTPEGEITIRYPQLDRPDDSRAERAVRYLTAGPTVTLNGKPVPPGRARGIILRWAAQDDPDALADVGLEVVEGDGGPELARIAALRIAAGKIPADRDGTLALLAQAVIELTQDHPVGDAEGDGHDR